MLSKKMYITKNLKVIFYLLLISIDKLLKITEPQRCNRRRRYTTLTLIHIAYSDKNQDFYTNIIVTKTKSLKFRS